MSGVHRRIRRGGHRRSRHGRQIFETQRRRHRHQLHACVVVVTRVNHVVSRLLGSGSAARRAAPPERSRVRLQPHRVCTGKRGRKSERVPEHGCALSASTAKGLSLRRPRLTPLNYCRGPTLRPARNISKESSDHLMKVVLTRDYRRGYYSNTHTGRHSTQANETKDQRSHVGGARWQARAKTPPLPS